MLDRTVHCVPYSSYILFSFFFLKLHCLFPFLFDFCLFPIYFTIYFSLVNSEKFSSSFVNPWGRLWRINAAINKQQQSVYTLSWDSALPGCGATPRARGLPKQDSCYTHAVHNRGSVQWELHLMCVHLFLKGSNLLHHRSCVGKDIWIPTRFFFF